MTLSHLIALASFGSAMNDLSTFGEYEEIHDFAKTWHDLLNIELEDLELRQVPHRDPDLPF